MTLLRTLTVSFAVIATAAQTAQAGHLGFGGGGLGLGGHHGGLGGGFGSGFAGFGGFDTEGQQDRFETKFTDLQTDYDSGLADIEDFYSSDEYSDVVGGVERLVDRYDMFLLSVERTIDRLTDVIDMTSDDLTFYQDLLTEYQERDDLSEERLERIESRLTSIQDYLAEKIDLLTEKQSTLSTNLSSYENFSTEISSYLSTIVAAGGSTTTGESTEDPATDSLALRSLAAIAAATDEVPTLCSPPEPLGATLAPEPAGQALAILGLSLLALQRPRRRAGARPSEQI